MDKQDLWRIGANCTDVDCKRAILNSDCFAGLCKCKAGFGPSSDQRKCKKSKKFGASCNPLSDTCYQEKLFCDPNSMICQCAPGYIFDSGKNDCIWYYYCVDNLIWDNLRRACIKPSDYWIPTTSHNPKLSFITFLLLVFCFIKVMRSNSPYRERRRRISRNMNRNSFDLLSTIMNYENNQRYQIRSADSRNGRTNHSLRRVDDDGQGIPSFDENQPPPPYEEIVSDLKTVTVISNINSSDVQHLTNNQEDIELKEMNQGCKIDLQANSQTNLNNNNNNQYSNCNHIDIQSTSSEASSVQSNLVNGDNNQSDSSSNDRQSSVQLNNQSSSGVDTNVESNNQSNTERQSNESSINQPNNSLPEDQLPTYQQAISKMPPV